MSSYTHPATHWRFSLRAALLAILLASLALALLHYLVQMRDSSLERARRELTTLSFVRVARALVDEPYGRLPYAVRNAGTPKWPMGAPNNPEAAPLYSWRFPLVSFLISDSNEPSMDESWDSPANAYWKSRDLDYYVYPTSPEHRNTHMTFMFAITGPGTAFGDGADEEPHSRDEIDADTILLVEVRNSGVHWMAPGDFDIRDMPRTINDPDGRGISSVHKDGFHVAFADGAVWYLSNDVPFEELAKFFVVDSARQYDRDTVLGPWRLARAGGPWEAEARD